MSKFLTHGLSALMEACNQSEAAEDSSEKMFEMFEEAIDEDIINAVTGSVGDADDDSVEADMAGEGVNDDKMEKLLAKIPPSDADIEDEIENLTESMVPSDELEYIY